MSFSKMVKDELLKKDFTVSEKMVNIEDAYENGFIRDSLRQSFLNYGSITDPNKDYYLEFSLGDPEEAMELLENLKVFSLNPKELKRGKKTIIYLKDSLEISDVLNIIGAHRAMMKFENVRIYKGMNEKINRRVNVETANINRTVKASLKQTEDIRLIDNVIGLSKLPKSLRDIANARLMNQEAPLSELASSLDPPIGKSGASHRMKKLMRLADELRKKELS